MNFLRRLYAMPALLWAALVYASGIGIRLIYTLSLQRPENFIYSDMRFIPISPGIRKSM